MFRRIRLLAMLFFSLIIAVAPLSFARENIKAIDKEMEEIQEIIDDIRSDGDIVPVPESIYTTVAVRALYVQNIQIIELLEQIRDLLQQGIKKDDPQQ